MKKGWQIKNLKEVCEVFDDGNWIESKDQSPDGIRLIQTGNIGEGVFKDRAEKARYISESTFKQLRCTEIMEGDCLVSRLPDPVGRSCILPDTGEKMITAVDCTILRFNHKQILPKFFNFYSQSDDYLITVAKECTGTTRNRISRGNLGLTPIPVPPLDEQKRIVALLDEAFENIAIAKANTEKNLQNAKALFESHLQSIFTQRGPGWVETRLEDVCELQNGFAFKSTTFKPFGSPILRISNIQDGRIEAGNRLVFFNPKDYRENLDRYRVNEGDLLIAMSGATTGKIGFNTDSTVYYLNQRVGKFEPSNKLNKHLLYYFLSTKVEENLRISAGAAQPNLSTEQIKGFILPLPPINEQERIVEALGTLSDETQRLAGIYQRKLAALEDLKKSLLQQAFTGAL
jgi:type I restriction enzyme, S subunit